MSRFDVAIVGGGQAGLATSWHLARGGIDHVVLEAGRVGETWRSKRWDSFCLVTPNWAVRVPGAEYAGADPDGFMPLAEVIRFFESWAETSAAPVLTGSSVSSIAADPSGGFLLTVNGDPVRARAVVVATGTYRRAHRPAGADQLPAGVQQLLAEDYRSPAQLPPGGVLVVGSGQTGCQLADELHRAGRRVVLACGRCPWWPRRLGGHDIVWWAQQSGFLDRTPDQLASPQARLNGNPQMTGQGGGRDLNFRTLHAQGVELVGRLLGVDGSTLRFADDLAASVDFGDAYWNDFHGRLESFCAATRTPMPEFEAPAPMRLETRTELDLVRAGVGAVIWTAGYRPEYGWVRFPVFDEMGFPIQVDGRTAVPGLFFVGVHWMRKNKSAILYGVGEDAEVVARQVAGQTG